MPRELSPESQTELAQLRATLNANNGEQLRYDTKRRAFRWWRPDAIDFHQERVPGFSPTPDEQEAIRDELDAAYTVRYCHRDPSDAAILSRWDLPDSDLELLDELESNNNRDVWVEAMTEHRRRQLAGLLRAYLGDEAFTKSIVLEWRQSADGRWIPAHQEPVVGWIERLIEEKGSKLAGYSAACGTIRSKLARRAAGKNKRRSSANTASSEPHQGVAPTGSAPSSLLPRGSTAHSALGARPHLRA